MDLGTIITTFIDKQTPEFAEKAVKLYKKGHQEGADVEKFKEELTELFFDYAALVMAQVLAYLRDEYDVNISLLSEEELTLILNNCFANIFVTDAEANVIFVNRDAADSLCTTLRKGCN